MKSNSVWEMIELGDVVRVAAGLVSPDDPAIAERAHVGPEHIRSGGGIIYSKLRTVAESGLISGKYAFDAKAVLYSKIRPKLNKVAIADFDGVCSADMYPIWPDERRLDRGFLYSVLTSERFVELATSRSFRTGIPKINREDLLAIRIELPPLPEQRNIAEILRTWDDAIDLGSARITQAQSKYLALVSELFAHSPRHRNVPLSRLVTPVKIKNSGGEINVLTSSGRQGLVSQSDYYNKSVASADISGYYLLENGDFAYNRSSSRGYPFGAIKRLDRYPRGVLSTLYLCFRLSDTEAVESDYLAHYFESGSLNRQLVAICQEGARSHGLLNVTQADFFELVVPVPDVERQRQVAQVLNEATEELVLLEKLQVALKAQKRGLMQKLLTGEIRVSGDDTTSPGEASDG